MAEMSEDITTLLADAKLDMLIVAAKREDVVRDEERVLARLTAETAHTDPWTAATKLFGGTR